MANHWAIAIGINQYQYYQPLIYAQRDAQVFRDFLILEAGFSPEQTLLVSDASLAVNHTTTYPSRSNIQTSLTQLCQQLQADDLLWCFFSGYGVRFEGNDYLLPVEANPAHLAETAISIAELFKILQSAATDQIVLVLDVNRSQSGLSGEGVGAQIAHLAEATGISTLLSCPPDQVSHETLALRQGLFTAALIEGIRHRGCITLDQLATYLNQRLPELSEHHWRPRQEPVAILSADKRHQLIVPEQAAITLGAAASAVALPAAGSPSPFQSVSSRYSNPFAHSTALLERSFELPSVETPVAAPPSSSSPAGSDTAPRPDRLTDQEPAGSDVAPAETKDDRRWRQRLIAWGGALAVILLAGVVLRNSQTLFHSNSSGSQKATTSNSGTASFGTPLSQAPTTTTSAASPSAEAGVPSPNLDLANLQVDPGSPLAAALTALQAQQFEEAARRLAQIPADQQDDRYKKLLEATNYGLLGKARTLLNRTRELTSENQASDFVEAIKVARQIQPKQPLYDVAQQDINRWSTVILDMAQGRAQRATIGSPMDVAQNYSGAIRAAGLVPTDRPEIYNSAQQAIAQWSQMILDLAKGQAEAGDLDRAIQVAELIPPEAPTYGNAQEAIAGWRNQPAPAAPPEATVVPDAPAQ